MKCNESNAMERIETQCEVMEYNATRFNVMQCNVMCTHERANINMYCACMHGCMYIIYLEREGCIVI